MPEPTPLQEMMFQALGVTPQIRELVNDLAKHAAQNAVASITTVAKTAPDPRLTNVIMLTACLLVGESAEATMSKRMEEVMERLPPDIKAMVEELHKEEAAIKETLKSETKKIRDFDGKYQ